MTRKLLKLISLSLALAAFLVFLFSLVSLATSNDYSRPGASKKIAYSSADILEALLDTKLSDAEYKYLELYGEYKITHGSNIPTSFVVTDYNESTGVLKIIARKYEYVAENGVKVTFLPSRVSILSREMSFSLANESDYVADFGKCEISDSDVASVVYKTEFEIDEQVISKLINLAYNDAVEWKKLLLEKENEYKSETEKYNEKRELYDAYLSSLAEYKSELALFNAYKAEKLIYDKKVAAHNKYLAEREDYIEKLQQYLGYGQELQKYNEKYLAYQKYLASQKEYEETYPLYNIYVEKLEILRTQLAIIDGLKNTSTELNRSVYSAIIGGTVDKVLENRDLIANSTTGLKPETVDMAGDATQNIRSLFEGYYKLEKENEKYTYYVVNYESFKNNFVNLFRALDKMYSEGAVKAAIINQGYQEKFEILLAQLYYVVNALSDGPVSNYDGTAYFDSSYEVNTLKDLTPLVILKNKPYIIDTDNASPLAEGYPDPVILPEVVEVPKPVKPVQIGEPIPPEKVENPGEPPIEVNDPGSPPKAVENPGEPPSPYKAPEGVAQLIAEYDAEGLGGGQRTTENVARTMTSEVTVNKKIVGVENYKVEFFDTDGNLICTAYVDEGTYAEYTGPALTKPEDASGTYRFDGWMDREGKTVNINNVHSDLKLYPHFDKTVKSYTVSWNVDGNITKTDVLYGEIPVYNGTPSKSDFENLEYVFEGWDKPIEAVSGEATYTAVFKSEYIYTAEDGTGKPIIRNDDGITVDLRDTDDSCFDVSKIIPRALKLGSISILTETASIEIDAENVKAMNRADVSSIKLESRPLEIGEGYSVIIRAFDSEGNELIESASRAYSFSEVKVNLSLPLQFANAERLRLYYFENGVKKIIRSTYDSESGVLDASYLIGKTYYAAVEYDVDLLPLGPITISVPQSARVGELIWVQILNVEPGISLDALYYLDAAGQRHEITDGSFVMSEGGVSVGADYSDRKYTVTFTVDGKVISTVTAKYGEEIAPPPAPEKAPDQKYRYVFIDWFPEITKVTSDTVYEARYMSIELPPKDNSGLQISQGALRIIMNIGFLAFYLGVVALPVLSVAAVKAVLRIRRKSKSVKSKESS